MNNGESNQATPVEKTGASVTAATTQTLEQKKKAKLQAALKKFVEQLKFGCQKKICFNEYCRNNINSK